MNGNKKRFICPLCHETYTEKCTLFKHIRRHVHKYTCEMCSVTFVRRRQWKTHQKQHYGNTWPESWKKKGKYVRLRIIKGYTRMSNVNIPWDGKSPPELVVNLRKKSYVCDVCQKCFSEKEHLKKHFTVHTTDICDSTLSKEFAEKFNLDENNSIDAGEKLQYQSSLSNQFAEKLLLTDHN